MALPLLRPGMNAVALLLKGRSLPDPARAHGAWVYLVLSALAGVLSSIGAGALAATGAGLGYSGAFLAASSFAAREPRDRRRRLFLGLFLGLAGPGLSLAAGASPFFLVLGLVALGPTALAGYFGSRKGFQSAPALGFAIAALAVAAPSAACAGGATLGQALLLLVLLGLFFTWRGLRLRAQLARHEVSGKKAIQAAGLREALLGTIWTLLVVALMHLGF